MAFNQLDKPQPGETIAIMKTNHGEMKIRLFVERVGECAQNFIDLANQGLYDGAPFHRIIKNFMIQGGDFTNRNGTGGHSAKGPGTTIDDKYDDCLSHMRGALSWAKTMMPKSIGSQFFIVHGEDVHFLDHGNPNVGNGPNAGYSVFGQLYEGFEVLDSIAGVKTDRRDAPYEDVIIESVKIEKV
ncbi:MAG: peptidylprolyl isomerase [Fibrobacter sp.]|nr:peptidylprolyl isomerase [Fibrobacter sp.]